MFDGSVLFGVDWFGVAVCGAACCGAACCGAALVGAGFAFGVMFEFCGVTVCGVEGVEVGASGVTALF